MLCERCHQRVATVHLTEISNNVKREMHLCEACARELQGGPFGWLPQFSLHNFLAGLFEPDVAHEALRPRVGGRRCGRCGLSEEEMARGGLLGCASCYDAFQPRLEPLLRRIHGTSRHAGKVPARSGGRAKVLRELQGLKKQLEEAVAREEFERAAVLRDHIRELERKLG